VATIDSLKDPRIQTARALGTRAGRVAAGYALAEGVRLVLQIIATGTEVEGVLVADGHIDEALAEGTEAAGVAVHTVRPGVLRHIIGSATPPDCLAIVALGPEFPGTAPPGRLTVVCDGVLDPGNLGSIIRTAHGLGCAAVVIAGEADVGSRRVIEASRGAVLRTSVHRFADGPAAVATLRSEGWLIVAADGTGQGAIEDVEVPGGRAALVVGNETRGLSPTVRREADVVAAIEIGGDVESLNVAVAVGIGLYCLRQRLPPA
jgi:TrmH family RNA methyltransferase